MQRYTRRELKHDALADTAQDTYSWAMGHSKVVVTIAIVALVVLLLAGAGWYYWNQRNLQASSEVGKALRIYQAPLVAPGTPAPPDTLVFASSKDRSRAANKEFSDIAAKYPHTNAGQLARYFAAITAKEMGNSAEAERTLNEIAGSRHYELASLAKFSLASIYRVSGRPDQAIPILKELLAKPSMAVPKITSKLELASLYEEKQPAEAIKIYEQIKNDDKKARDTVEAESKNPKLVQNSDVELLPNSAVELASARLAALKGSTSGPATGPTSFNPQP